METIRMGGTPELPRKTTSSQPNKQNEIKKKYKKTS